MSTNVQTATRNAVFPLLGVARRFKRNAMLCWRMPSVIRTTSFLFSVRGLRGSGKNCAPLGACVFGQTLLSTRASALFPRPVVLKSRHTATQKTTHPNSPKPVLQLQHQNHHALHYAQFSTRQNPFDDDLRALQAALPHVAREIRHTQFWFPHCPLNQRTQRTLFPMELVP